MCLYITFFDFLSIVVWLNIISNYNHNMNLEELIWNYNINKTKELEQTQDSQFLALQKAWTNIWDISKENKEKFLILIIQNSIISYQLAWQWEFRWTEFGKMISKEFANIDKIDNLWWWQNVLSNCRYNCRLANMKYARLLKLKPFVQGLNIDVLKAYYNNMSRFNNDLAKSLNNKPDTKTIVFATKMFGYWARIVLDKFVPYPMDVDIPIDSRLTKIYENQTWKIPKNKKIIQNFYKNLSKKYKIPPLHLDSVLWIDFWNRLTKKQQWISKFSS